MGRGRSQIKAFNNRLKKICKIVRCEVDQTHNDMVKNYDGSLWYREDLERYNELIHKWMSLWLVQQLDREPPTEGDNGIEEKSLRVEIRDLWARRVETPESRANVEKVKLVVEEIFKSVMGQD